MLTATSLIHYLSLYRHRLTVLLLSMVVTALIGCSNHAGIDSTAPAVSFKTLKSAEPIVLSELAKPVLINFWSTTCVYCLKEMPDLAKVYERYQPKGFELIAVAMPYDRPSDVLALAQSNQWPFKVAIDIDSKLLEAFAPIEATPTSFLIDAQGRIVKKYVGVVDIDKLELQLNTLLGHS